MIDQQLHPSVTKNVRLCLGNLHLENFKFRSLMVDNGSAGALVGKSSLGKLKTQVINVR